MSKYGERTYRKRISSDDLVSFHVSVKETDLWVSSDVKLEKEARDLVLNCRRQLEAYIHSHPGFSTSLLPWPEDPYAPALVKEMIEAARKAGVGPMASVAGAIAQYVGVGLLSLSEQVIVENGGDIFLKANRALTVSIFAGSSPFSERIGLVIAVRQMPLGVCSSSATVGHSMSMGIADAVCIVSTSAALADGAATALGNRIKRKSDVSEIASRAIDVKEILGGVVIVEDTMATWGDIELVEL